MLEELSPSEGFDYLIVDESKLRARGSRRNCPLHPMMNDPSNFVNCGGFDGDPREAPDPEFVKDIFQVFNAFPVGRP